MTHGGGNDRMRGDKNRETRVYNSFRMDIGPSPIRAKLGNMAFENILTSRFGSYIRNSITPISNLTTETLGEFYSKLNYPGRGAIAKYKNNTDDSETEIIAFQLLGVINWRSFDIIDNHINIQGSHFGTAIFGSIRSRSQPWGGAWTEYKRDDSLNDSLPFCKAWDTGTDKECWLFFIKASSSEARARMFDFINKRIAEEAGRLP